MAMRTISSDKSDESDFQYGKVGRDFYVEDMDSGSRPVSSDGNRIVDLLGPTKGEQIFTKDPDTQRYYQLMHKDGEFMGNQNVSSMGQKYVNRVAQEAHDVKEKGGISRFFGGGITR